MKRDKAGYYYFIDRIGDTFRWKGENVSTLEVENAVASCPGVAEVAVYGVAVPGFDGRAGMAAIVVDGRFSPETLHAHVSKLLPSYARPLLIRIVPELAVTETFKQKKQLLIDEGYDPSQIADPLLIDDARQGTYAVFTATDYARLMQSRQAFA
jgi:fatty-acyl-CoA synthase